MRCCSCWIRNWSHFARLLIFFAIVLLLLLGGRTLFKKSKSPSFQIRSGWNLARLFSLCIDWRSRIFDMTSYFQDMHMHTETPTVNRSTGDRGTWSAVRHLLIRYTISTECIPVRDRGRWILFLICRGNAHRSTEQTRNRPPTAGNNNNNNTEIRKTFTHYIVWLLSTVEIKCVY